ncbi:MAG TPA: MATE family efflux transporter [Alphaproteobacteria bacterium]|nr:MATE family efflux transporter [Alphaproteobacteria bacterium]
MSAANATPRLSEELKATIHLATPIAAAQLAQVAMGATDTILLGSIGRDALAAGGLGANLFFVVSIVFQSVLVSVGILVAQARGAGNEERIGSAMRGGFLLAPLIALLPMLFLWQVEPIMMAIGEAPDLAHAIGRYDRVMLLAAPAMMWLGAQRAYLSAMARPGMVMAVSLAAVLINGFANYGLIHGAFGLPKLGYIGSCTATTLTLWGMAAAVGLAMRFTPMLQRFRLAGPIPPALLRELLQLGWPIAITVGLEIVLFGMSGLIMAMFGATALAAHQVSMNIASTTFMVPFALAQAANVRVGFHIGANAPGAAKKAAELAFALGVGFMAVAGIVLVTVPGFIIGLYLDPSNPENQPVFDLAVQLLAIAALFQVFDGAQTIAIGSLRGIKDTRAPMLIAAIGYWAIGFPVALALAFLLGVGPRGIWWGFVFGLSTVAILLAARFWILIKRMVGAPDATRLVPESAIG